MVFFQQHRNTIGGFTLTELMVVIAIIGILSSVVIVSLGGARAKARDAKRVAELKSAQLALELYYDACREYPADSGGALHGPATSSGCPSGVTLATFLSIIPKDPSGSNYLYYAQSGTYVLRATLETSHSELDADVDGTVSVDGQNVNCNDASFYYCLRP